LAAQRLLLQSLVLDLLTPMQVLVQHVDLHRQLQLRIFNRSQFGLMGVLELQP
jgi:hypothetical protein